jgi:hypothetical protein
LRNGNQLQPCICGGSFHGSNEFGFRIDCHLEGNLL